MRPWLADVLALVVGLVAGGAVVFAFILPTLTKPVGTVTESRDTQVIQAIERQEEVVLVSLGIQGIAEESTQGTILGQRIPGTGRTKFLQYNYRALLGIDGAKREHVDANRDLLQDQAENFYRGIILGVSPDAKVTFRFGSTR